MTKKVRPDPGEIRTWTEEEIMERLAVRVCPHCSRGLAMLDLNDPPKQSGGIVLVKHEEPHCDSYESVVAAREAEEPTLQ